MKFIQFNRVVKRTEKIAKKGKDLAKNWVSVSTKESQMRMKMTINPRIRKETSQKKEIEPMKNMSLTTSEVNLKMSIGL